MPQSEQLARRYTAAVGFSPLAPVSGERGRRGVGGEGRYVTPQSTPSPPTPLPRNGGEGRKAYGGGIEVLRGA